MFSISLLLLGLGCWNDYSGVPRTESKPWPFHGPLTTEPMGPMQGAFDFYWYLPPITPKSKSALESVLTCISSEKVTNLDVVIKELSGPRAWFAPIRRPPPLVLFVWGVESDPGFSCPPQTIQIVIKLMIEKQSQDDLRRLLLTLDHPDERVRLDAVRQLIRAKATDAVQSLTATLIGDPTPQVREAAAQALIAVGGSAALSALREAVRNDHDEEVRRMAQLALDLLELAMTPLHGGSQGVPVLPPRPVWPEWGGYGGYFN